MFALKKETEEKEKEERKETESIRIFLRFPIHIKWLSSEEIAIEQRTCSAQQSCSLYTSSINSHA
jgi:hypothetical protein